MRTNSPINQSEQKINTRNSTSCFKFGFRKESAWFVLKTEKHGHQRLLFWQVDNRQEQSGLRPNNRNSTKRHNRRWPMRSNKYFLDRLWKQMIHQTDKLNGLQRSYSALAHFYGWIHIHKPGTSLRSIVLLEETPLCCITSWLSSKLIFSTKTIHFWFSLKLQMLWFCFKS